MARLALANWRSALSEATEGSTVMGWRVPKPRGVAIAGELAAAGLRRLGDQHVERQAGQRPRRHDQQVLALDQVLDRPEQRL